MKPQTPVILHAYISLFAFCRVRSLPFFLPQVIAPLLCGRSCCRLFTTNPFFFSFLKKESGLFARVVSSSVPFSHTVKQKRKKKTRQVVTGQMSGVRQVRTRSPNWFIYLYTYLSKNRLESRNLHTHSLTRTMHKLTRRELSWPLVFFLSILVVLISLCCFSFLFLSHLCSVRLFLFSSCQVARLCRKRGKKRRDTRLIKKLISSVCFPSSFLCVFLCCRCEPLWWGVYPTFVSFAPLSQCIFLS